MSKRVLPSRSTRGTKPIRTQEQELKDNELYASLFGKNLDDDEEYIESNFNYY